MKAPAPPLSFEEAKGIGLTITSIQRRMLLNLHNWPDNDATAYNRDELLWKELIFRTSWSPAYRLTERGTAVVMALHMRALSDSELIARFEATNGYSLEAVAALREIEDRCLDL